jgi:glutaredoxin
MSTSVLYHDGCAICLSIAERFASAPGLTVEIVNLCTNKHRAREAQAAGVTRLPSLVIGGQVMRLEDHSSIEHML